MRALVLFYSMYGHTYRMAEAMAEGIRSVDGTEVALRRVPETVPEDLLRSSGAAEAQKAFSHIGTATVDELADYELIAVGTPTRYGNMCGQMRNFWDQTGALWDQRALVGVLGTAFTGSATQHGGQETTIVTVMLTLLHHGMVIVGLPYSWEGQSRHDEVTGGSPYGAATIVGGEGDERPSENELAGARFQGAHAAKIARRLCADR